MNSKKIKIDLDRINIRLEELQPQLDAQTKAYETAQTAYACKKLSFEDLQGAAASLDNLSKVVDGLLSAAGKFEQEYAEAVESEVKQNQIDNLKATTGSAKAALDDYIQARSEFNEAARKTAAALDAFRLEQTRFADQFRALVPHFDGFRVVSKLARPEYEATIARLTAAGVSTSDLALATSQNPPLPQLEYAYAIQIAEMTNIQRMSELAQKQRQDGIDKVRARAAEMKAAADAKLDREKRERVHRQNRWVGPSRANA